jgi:hypothetical protein
MAMTWGVGQGDGLPWHHDPPLPKWFNGFITSQGTGQEIKDMRYEKAEEYVDEAIQEGRRRGIKFPPTLSGPSTGPPETWGDGAAFDTVGRDLLLVKAGVLERVGSISAVDQSRELYEQVLQASRSDGSPGQEATVMRLAHKVGEMCVRAGKGDEGIAWWAWALKRVALRIPKEPEPIITSTWFGFGKSRTTYPDPVPQSTEMLPHMAPPIHRATITILASLSAHFAMTGKLPLASTMQLTALSILPGTHELPSPVDEEAPMILHDTWLQHRSATITLHHSEILHALRDVEAQYVCDTACERAANVMSTLDPMPKPWAVVGVPWHSAAVSLQRDAYALVAESSYTKAVLLELSNAYDPDEVMALYENAMKANEKMSGRTVEEAMDDDWWRYNTRYLKVKGVFGKRDLMDEVEGEDEEILG